MSTWGLVDWVILTTLSRRCRLRRWPRATSTDDCVMPLMSLCVLATMASAPADMASSGRPLQKRRCGPQAWSTTSGRPAPCATPAMASSAAHTPLLLGETTNTALASGCSATAAATRSTGTFRGMPQSGSISGST